MVRECEVLYRERKSKDKGYCEAKRQKRSAANEGCLRKKEWVSQWEITSWGSPIAYADFLLFMGKEAAVVLH